MTNLQNRNSATLETLTAIQQSIENLQAQLTELNNQFSKATVVANGQATLTKEWTEKIAPLKELFICACGVYGDASVLKEMVADVQAIADEVENNFETHKQEPNRFLGGDNKKPITKEVQKLTEVIEVQTEIITEDEPLPDKEDDTVILSDNQITQILEPLSVATIKQLQVMFNVSMKLSKRSLIAAVIAKSNITFYKLSRLIANIEGQQSLLAGL